MPKPALRAVTDAEPTSEQAWLDLHNREKIMLRELAVMRAEKARLKADITRKMGLWGLHDEAFARELEG